MIGTFSSVQRECAMECASFSIRSLPLNVKVVEAFHDRLIKKIRHASLSGKKKNTLGKDFDKIK